MYQHVTSHFHAYSPFQRLSHVDDQGSSRRVNYEKMRVAGSGDRTKGVCVRTMDGYESLFLRTVSASCVLDGNGGIFIVLGALFHLFHICLGELCHHNKS